MTRARALKQVIRARAAKTGERYTTARRHVLAHMRLAASGAKGAKGAKSAIGADGDGAKGAATKGGLSDAKSIEKTGHDLAHWFDVMDRFGGVAKSHTELATHLYDEHKVPGWYCQGIVVSYERARGKRAMNQRCDGAFEVSVSKVMAAKPAAIIKALKDGRTWADGVEPSLLKALAGAVKDKKSKGFVTRADGQARFRYKWDGMTVQFNMYPKGAKTSFVVQHMNLADAGAVEKYRALWKTAFGAMADALR
jgi:hypothetical protein